MDRRPKQVPAYSPGQYARVEQFYLKEPQKSHLLRCFLKIFLKLNCYVDIRVSCDFGESWVDNPIPDELEAIITKDDNSTVYVLFPDSDTLATLDKGDTNMTVFNPDDRLLNFLIKLAGSEGLFVWQPPQS